MLLNEYAHVKQSSATDALLSFFETLERNASGGLRVQYSISLPLPVSWD